MASRASWSQTTQHHAWSGRVLCNAVQTTLKGRIRVDFTGWPFTSAFFGALAKSESERNACSVERRNELIAFNKLLFQPPRSGSWCSLVWAQSVLRWCQWIRPNMNHTLYRAILLTLYKTACTAHVTCEQEVFFSTVESRAVQLLQATI